MLERYTDSNRCYRNPPFP